ncbi:MAG: phosphonopyruvate decarboxylase [Eubacterium sp.]|nr:phosphonopyruvate decarboxylase [Eubacterium sp.]
MKVQDLVNAINSDFYAGVPDSLLAALGNYLVQTYGVTPEHHVITANEGNAVAAAAGYHFATGKVPVVYMQNSGQGNIVNPVASLCNEKVYAVPMLYIVGWRGEPGVHDEPQHIFQGEITLKLLEDMDIPYYVIDKETTADDIILQMQGFKKLFAEGKQAAFVVRKGALTYDVNPEYTNDYSMTREEIISRVIDVSKDDIVIATTGKTGRELFELREARGEGHEKDFLTVGSMGHSSSIAMGIAAQKKDKTVWVLDGDGAMLMHMGGMAVIGSSDLDNLIHIVINNGAHESVGGLPTVAENIDILKIAEGCGYSFIRSAKTSDELDKVLEEVKDTKGRAFIEIKSRIGSRPDLGRPTIPARINKENFMEYIK